MKMKKLVVMLLALTIVVSVFSGCGNKENTNVQIPISKEPFEPQKDMEIRAWVTQGSDYVPPVMAKENLVGKWLQDKTKVTVKNAFGNGGGSWEATMAQLIAGDNFPELVVCGGGQGPAHFSKLAQAKQIWELTPEVLQTYAPDVWERVPQEMWERMKVNGKIYGIPYSFPVDRRIDPDITEPELSAWGSAPASNIGTSLWIRDDILKMIYPDAKDYEELNALLDEKGAPIGDEIYDVPLDSTEKVIDLMRKIDDLDLKVGNKKVYAFGYAGADCWVPFARLGAEIMGYVGHNYITSWNTKTHEIEIPLLGETIKETALLQNRLIREEVIDPESLMHTDAKYKEKVLNGEYAIAILSAVEHPPIINSTLEKAGKEFHYRPLYTKIPSIEGFDVTTTNISWGSSIGLLKTIKAEDVPQILNWINTQFTEEWEEIRYWGPKEAGLYVDTEDGGRLFKNEEMNKKFIYGEKTDLQLEDCYGIGDAHSPINIRFKSDNKWHWMLYNNKINYVLLPENGGKISPDSPLKVDAEVAPPYNAWDAEYADLETVTEFWSRRGTWEDPFKLTLAAKSDKEFEQKWQAAVDNLKSIVDVDKMTKEMTEIARGLME